MYLFTSDDTGTHTYYSTSVLLVHIKINDTDIDILLNLTDTREPDADLV